jgi:geranylgeranyl pyrophosphate synthase
MTSGQVLEIFRRKTAPAFEVALKIGAILAGIDAYESVRDVLTKYSEAIGIAYQIKDDLEDFEKEAQDNDLHRLRPNLILATAYDRALNNETKALLESIWHRRLPHGYSFEKIKEIYRELKADERARILMETFKEEAIRSLKPLDNPDLKGLLRRIIGKIFNDVQICGWCREFEERNKIINNGSQG